jgi:hypothetical protein
MRTVAMAQENSRNMLQLNAPPALTEAVKLAADRELTTVSEFVRRTLIDRLRSIGIDPAQGNGQRASGAIRGSDQGSISAAA